MHAAGLTLGRCLTCSRGTAEIKAEPILVQACFICTKCKKQNCKLNNLNELRPFSKVHQAK